MEVLEYLKTKDLIDNDKDTFTIIKEDKEYNLIEIIEEYTINKEDKYLRLMAEFDNYKKRVTKEKEELKDIVKIKTLKSILDVNSELEIATNSVDSETKKQFILFTDKIKKFLEKENISEIPCDIYNEDIHEVISVVPNDKLEILNVVSKGYRIKDKIIQYPKIVLGKPNE
jgi:molecular chaperone GrpE